MATRRHNELRDACLTWLRLTQANVTAWANDTGVYVRKVDGRWVRGRRGFGTKGVPDILGWRGVNVLDPDTTPGLLMADLAREIRLAQFLAIDIKIGGDILSPEQAEFLEQLLAAGGLGFVVRDSVDDLARQWQEAVR